MAITSLLYFRLVLASWGWSLPRGLLVLCLFLVDLPFLAAICSSSCTAANVPLCSARAGGGDCWSGRGAEP